MATPPPIQDAFEKLLRLLHPDRERAGAEYELLRLKLLEYFRARACPCAEELTDEVLDRLLRKIAEGEEVRDVPRYCYGLARWVWAEYLKRPGRVYVTFEEMPDPPSVTQESLEQKERNACYQHCLNSLSPEDHVLIVEYSDHEHQTNREARRALAERKGMTMTALRIRVCRIRDRLAACKADCLKNGVPKKKT
jgi:DNA-directed RNA polymerase specialized sigma24 family protein